jgi:hypothetical protein
MSAPQSFEIDAARTGSPQPVEVTVPLVPLNAQMYAELLENDTPTNNIIRVDDESSAARVHWRLRGPLAKSICRYWCVSVRFESIGAGPEFRLDADPIALNPCGNGIYWTDIKLHPHVTAEHCSSVYKVVVTLTYKLPCKDSNGKYLPGPMAGHFERPLVQFYESAQ